MNRITCLRFLTIGAVLFLIAGLWNHQVKNLSHYRLLSERNRVRLVPAPGARGVIYDRNGVRLVDNRPSFDIAVMPEELEDEERTLWLVSDLIDVSPEHLRDRLRKSQAPPFIPVVVARDVGKLRAMVIEERQAELPGIIIRTTPMRRYVYKDTTSHLTGYLGRLSPDELLCLKRYGYKMRDLIGKAGIEKAFDRTLKGKCGGMQVEVDNNGRVLAVLGVQEPEKGQDLYLTIDIRLQRFIANLLKGTSGAIVCMEPEQGDILALTSWPNFDPNIFTSRDSNAEIRKLLASKKAPFLNRAISTYCAPGSIFKIVVATAGLETNAISPDTRFTCRGSYNIGGRDFKCWNESGHGSIDLEKGLLHSCNVFFYRLGLRIGPDNISRYAGLFGLGRKTGVELPGERKGLIPSPRWKASQGKGRWYDGDTANLSIGQGYILLTPIQAVRMVSVIANGGTLVRPHIIRDGEGRFKAVPLPFSATNIMVVKRGLEKAISDAEGTAHRAYVSEIRAAAKTGTTEVGGKRRSHAWLVGFAPVDRPRISFAIFLEHGGSGAGKTSKLAGELIRFVKENPDI